MYATQSYYVYTFYAGYRNTHDLVKFGWNWFCDYHELPYTKIKEPEICIYYLPNYQWSTNLDRKSSNTLVALNDNSTGSGEEERN